MYFEAEQSRTQTLTAEQLIRGKFPVDADAVLDAEFLTADRSCALGFLGLPYPAPICCHLLNDYTLNRYFAAHSGSHLLKVNGSTVIDCTESGEEALPQAEAQAVLTVLSRLLSSPGHLNEKGEHVLDLKNYPVGSHFPINLLLGNREGYEHPLVTTPKAAIDALGRGSFRGTGGKQVLATRYVLSPSENGEPANRQFYLIENGRQIFYSANIHENVASATCVHSQSRTQITYETGCGLRIRRTIFILPQKPGMPNAVEAQRVTIENLTGEARQISIVFTGMFGITEPVTIANDILYANLVIESEVFYQGGKAAAVSLHHKPKDCQDEKRFALLLAGGETMDGFCASLEDFIGSGTLDHPELVTRLPNRYNRKLAPFFAMSKALTVPAKGTATADCFVGMMEKRFLTGDFDETLNNLISRYRSESALQEELSKVRAYWDKYPKYLEPETAEPLFNAYVSHNLPFQTLYQTYVSRAFAWTQKSYREVGFREIQDIFASMYYLSANGQSKLIPQLLSGWITNVYEMGYANHDFTFTGKEPGDCSDDQLWLVQAVSRYVTLTGDTAFLQTAYPVAGSEGKERTLWETLKAILTYSGKISVGKHGIPLLDKADWNDTLRLDHVVLKGPGKEAAYRQQLADENGTWGDPWHNELSESVMNGCLLKIAADAMVQMAALQGLSEDQAFAQKISDDVAASIQKNAWKQDYFARCLINDGREYTYLGATGDKLNLEAGMPGTYFLNSYSWPILAHIATESQIAAMIEIVEKYLKTDAGLKLCTLVDFDRLEINTGTALYFPGDRENGGVFKHAAMMAAVASMQAAKVVSDPALSQRLRELGFFMMGRVMPYRTMESPFILRGNPRFCTQYNNSQTGENIGPMLSGTASWLTLAVYEYLGVKVTPDALDFDPILKPGQTELAYRINLEDAQYQVRIHGSADCFHRTASTVVKLDGQEVTRIPRASDGKLHSIEVIL